MKIIRWLMVFFCLALNLACSEQSEVARASSLQALLAENTQWPYPFVATLDIVEAGGYGESAYPEWAVGSIFTADDEEGVSIFIEKGVAAEAKVDVDSGRPVKVWLAAPVKKRGFIEYAIVKMEAL